MAIERFNARSAYDLGYREYSLGHPADDNPFMDDELADSWENGFWDACERKGPCEAALDARYGKSKGSLF